MTTLFDASPQCCDADGYMQFGQECAENIRACYGDLRPVGDYLWFSLPMRFGMKAESIVILHVLLALLSVFFCAYVLRRFLIEQCNKPVSKKFYGLLLLMSLLVHAVFLRPTIFNTLSDPPSAVMLLFGLGLLVLCKLHKGSEHGKSGLLLLAGIFLGFSAWVRAFYLYPVLFCVLVYFFLWLFHKGRQWKELLLLVALIPIATQFFVMHRVYGTFSYLQQDTQNEWMQVHLNAPFIGFDTVMPRNGYFWYPQHCESQVGIFGGLEQGKYREVLCVISERIRFYLGTYENKTYIYSDAKSYLVRQYSENVGDIKADWFSQNLAWEGDVAMSPNGQQTADKLTVITPEKGGSGDTVQWVLLPSGTPFTFSVWLWSPKPKTINLAIKLHEDDHAIAKKQFFISEKPTRYFVTGTTTKTGLYDVNIGRTPYAEDVTSFGSEAGDFFYVWGAELERGDTATAYDAAGKITPSSVRQWAPWLLVINAFAFFIVAIMLFRLRAFWFRTKVGIAVLAFFAVVLAESVAIIPEQRFATGWMIVLWLSTSATLLVFFRYTLPSYLKRHTQ